MKVTILGCGGSGGVPRIGGVWGECDPHNPKNRRRRVSILVQQDDTNVLVDFGPDLREQLNGVHVTKIDAALMTHVHADHTFGIDDLRRLYIINNSTPVPIHGRPADFDELNRRFDYAFRPFHYGVGLTPPLERVMLDMRPFRVGSIEIVPFEQSHGKITSLGFRFGDFAYSTDVKTLSEDNFATLAGIKAWVVDCVREEEHPAHSHLAQTLEWIQRVGPERAWLTHMDIGLDYAKTLAKCPAGVEPAYDGLEITV